MSNRSLKLQEGTGVVVAFEVSPDGHGQVYLQVNESDVAGVFMTPTEALHVARMLMAAGNEAHDHG